MAVSSSGSNGVEEWQWAPGLAASSEPSIGVYSEDEEDVTQFVDTPRPEPKWIVQITPFDRRQMSTEGLLQELRRDQLVHRESLVWRGGNAEWRSIAQVDELQTEGQTRSNISSGRGLRGSTSLRKSQGLASVLAASAAAFLAGAVTLYALARAGAFAAGGQKERSAMGNDAPIDGAASPARASDPSFPGATERVVQQREP